MSEIHKSRNRIAGKKYTAEEYPKALEDAILKQIEEGDCSPESIGGKLGKHRSVISKAIHEYAEQGKIQLTDTGRIEKIQSKVEQREYSEMTVSDFISKNPEVKKWVDDMQHRGKAGRPLKTMTGKLAYFKKSCDVLKLNPSAFAVSTDVNNGLLQQLRDQVLILNPALREGGWRGYAMSVRNFAASNGVAWERNMAPSIASGKKTNYGSYSMIHATDEQREGIIRFARENFSADLSMAILIGHEVLCPRDETLRTLKVGDIRFRQRGGFEMAEFGVFESKTETSWPKQALDPRIVKLLKHHMNDKAPGSFVFGNGNPIRQEDLSSALRRCYGSVGIDVESNGNEKMINYWKVKPIHVMRHTTATLWMRRSGMNPMLVANQGWKDVNMVTQVYANMGLEEGWNANRCDYCKPEQNVSGDSHYCGWKCALAGLNVRFGN